jgi:thioredoxin 1
MKVRMDAFLTINENNFEQEVQNSAQPVVLEFGAVWCQPCKQLEPVLLKLGQEWGGKVRMAKVDVDESVNLTMKFQVMGVPTVILFVNGQPAARFSGFLPREKILNKLEPHLV